MIDSIIDTFGIIKFPTGLNSVSSYKKKFRRYGCFDPGCKSGVAREVHHIIPKSRGGKDEYVNYIILCSECHRRNKNHANYYERRATLWTWKFYFEAKCGDKGILSLLSPGNSKSKNSERRTNPKILLKEMQKHLSQSAKKKGKYRRICKRPPCPVRQAPLFAGLLKELDDGLCWLSENLTSEITWWRRRESNPLPTRQLINIINCDLILIQE